MKVYVFSTPHMYSGILINANNIREAKTKIRHYLCTKRLPKHTTVEEYHFNH